MIEALEHAALSVSDLDRSIAFYRDLLGFAVARIVECPPSMRLGDVVGLPGCSARIAHLVLGSSMLELFEYTNPRGARIPGGRTQADIGFIHIGLRCSDARGEYRRLCERGVPFFHEPLEFRPGVWIAYFRGPDGEVCELRESRERSWACI
jgi:catechol 2,3-dioxygenase-like lactoylglutathione lyase family enzyme